MVARRSSAGDRVGLGGAPPRTDELLPMRRRRARQSVVYDIELVLVLLGSEQAADELEAQVDEKCVHDVSFAVAADAAQLAPLIGVPHLAAIHTELAGEAKQPR